MRFLIVGGVTSLNYYLMGRPEIKTPEQLKGGSVAISRFGSSADFIARYALSKIRPESRKGCHDCSNRQHYRAGGRCFDRASAGDGLLSGPRQA